MSSRRNVLTAVAIVLVCASGASAAPMITLYETKLNVKRIVAPGTSGALPIDGRLHVVEPNSGHLYAGDRDIPYRLDKVDERTLIALGTETRIAAYLKNRIDNPCVFSWGTVKCASHIVMIDEITPKFGEPAPNIRVYPWTLPRDKRPAFRPTVREGQPGLELSQAMQILANAPYRGGGNYAQRVHFFFSPGPVSSIGTGLGAYHNLWPNGLPARRTYEGLRRAFQLSGGVWLEMYHAQSGRRYPFNTAEWRRYPNRVLRWMTKPGTSVTPDSALIAKTHFLMTKGMPARVGRNLPGACSNSRRPQACQFALASSKFNRRLLASGPGAYRLEGNVGEWRRNVVSRFFR